jgi:hypothetical protein
MDGKFLTSNIGPLKVIGDGKVFVAINDLLNTNRFKKVELAAYEIADSNSRIVTIHCLFIHAERGTLYYRQFAFFESTESVNDDLKLTAEHGIGFGDFEMFYFQKLRDWYLQNIKVSAEVAQ